MTQRRPLVDALLEFQRKRPISFHVPGHKNGLLSGLPKELKAALIYDMTELEGLDDLHAPNAAIKEAEDLLADAYGSKKLFSREWLDCRKSCDDPCGLRRRGPGDCAAQLA